MGWITDSGLHEGYLEAVLVDGSAVSTYGAAGPIAMIYDAAGTYTGEDVQRTDDEIVAWRLACDCSSERTGERLSPWIGPTWRRVATPAAEDLENGRIYAPPGEASEIPDRDDVEEVARAQWLAEHMAPIESLTEIERAQDEIRSATARLDQAVAYARASGKSWADIGAAAGMSRQAAHDRWASRFEPRALP